MENTFAILSSYIPADIQLMDMLKFIVIFSFLSIFLGLLGRVVFGARSDLNHAVSSVMGILFVYAASIVICTFNPKDLAQYLAPLPFVMFDGSTLYLFSFVENEFSVICSQVLSMLILAFLVNLLDSIIPKGKKTLVWYLLRFLSVALAIVLHAVASWAMDTYLPDVLVQYAPIVLVVALVSSMLMGVVNLILGAILAITNPVLGALYAFFFGTVVGKQLSKSVLTTVILCVLVFLLGHFGYAAISISAAALGAYIPLILALLFLWYLIGHAL